MKVKKITRHYVCNDHVISSVTFRTTPPHVWTLIGNGLNTWHSVNIEIMARVLRKIFLQPRFNIYRIHLRPSVVCAGEFTANQLLLADLADNKPLLAYVADHRNPSPPSSPRPEFERTTAMQVPDTCIVLEGSASGSRSRRRSGGHGEQGRRQKGLVAGVRR
jgi:hypothetical protein